MRITKNMLPAQLNRLGKIERAVKQAEKKLMPNALVYKTNGWRLSPTNGPRDPVYEATPPIELLGLFESLSETIGLSSYRHFADLGSGLGMASFTAAAIFEKVTGFECDARLLSKAEEIRRQFGITNVNFLKKDFTRQRDLKDFDIVYFYKPFREDFIHQIGKALGRTKSGTLIISRIFTDEHLFDRRRFTPIYPPDWEPSNQFYVSMFYVLERK